MERIVFSSSDRNDLHDRALGADIRDNHLDAFEPFAGNQIFDDAAFGDHMALMPQLTFRLMEPEATTVAQLPVIGHGAVGVGFVLFLHRKSDVDASLHFRFLLVWNSTLKVIV